MRSNEAYRQRFRLPADVQAAAEQHRERITAALQVAANRGPLGEHDVSRVLAPVGYPASAVQAYGRSDVGGGLAVGVSTGSGCVYGGVRQKTVTLEVGGGIADGGCLPAQGH